MFKNADNILYQSCSYALSFKTISIYMPMPYTAIFMAAK